MKKLPHKTAAEIKKARIARGYRTERDLAVETGLSSRIIREYERGGHAVDDFVLKKIQDTLRIELQIT